MSAAELLEKANAAGVDFILVGDRVRLRAAQEPPAELVEEMRRHRAELVALLDSRPRHRAYRFRLHGGEGGGVYISDETALDRARDALASRYGDRLAMVTPA